MGSISTHVDSTVSSDETTVLPSSPLYFLPSDSPGTMLVSSTFDGTDYGRGMLLGLSCKNKLGMIRGTIPKPNPDSPLFENDMVVAWIPNSLDQDIRETVMYTESAERLWNEIEKRFGQASGIKIYQIRKEISSVSQGTSSISSYFNRIKKLWDELSYSISYPDCVCGCKEKFQKLDEDQKVHQFLMGLNESYSTIRRSILLMKPLPDVDSVYTMLVNDESQFTVQTAIPSFNTDSVAFSTDTVKRPGHSIEKCFKLHGFPPGFLAKFKRTAAFAQVSDTQSQSQPEVGGDVKQVTSDSGGTSITKEKFDQLMNLLQQSKIQTSPQEITAGSANFADSGATNYMTPHSSFLFDIKPLISPYLFNLPNGYIVKVTCTGTLTLTPEISLTNRPVTLGSLQNKLYVLNPATLTSSCNSIFNTSFVNTITANSINDMNKSSSLLHCPVSSNSVNADESPINRLSTLNINDKQNKRKI
ncbi:PREDICTED: uncharacterized protein LOC109217124 [Nicotiana attenuata]|uniref:uncharacterized protein LOC109217124 n=1 Tax=Nicotiana attenuata TaxID=49451 RepID=UPI00090530AB|nr:PREDICTED: uncharacterized protein LOC109217124 [Nicotiana attenuata]